MIAIQDSKSGFHPLWIDYCEKNEIPYKLVNCYSTDIINELKSFSCLFWHFSHINSKDIIVAKTIMNSLSHINFKIFPNWETAWHFDNKIGQKYLLEAIDAPIVPSYVFYDKKSAISFIENYKFPIVWKLKKGAGSSNVKLLRNKTEALKYIDKAFGNGFDSFNKFDNFKESFRNSKFLDLSRKIKAIGRLFFQPEFSKISQKEIGYIYFQKFIPNNSFDIRIITINGKSFALKRYVREGDFRASGSGKFNHNKEEFDVNCIKIANKVTKELKAQCLAFDFVFDEKKKPLIVEISYGFSPHGYFDCPGYWEEDLTWIEGKFNPYGWMIDMNLNYNKI